MNPEIKKILNELYETDPTLRQKERTLMRVITAMQKIRPDARMDAHFHTQLREALKQKAAEMKTGHEPQKFFSFNIFKIIMSKRLVGVSLAGVALFALVFGYVLYQDSAVESLSLLSTRPEISRLGTQAFGDFSSLAFSSRPQSGGGGVGGLGGDAEAGAGGGGFGLTVPAPVDYRYVYQGDDIEQSQEQVTVYRRGNTALSSEQVSSILRRLNVGVADLGSFSQAGLQNFTLTENREYGYLISVDVENGTVNISQDWRRWPDLPPFCYGPECPSGTVQLSLSDIPSDEHLIMLAQDFLNSHGIASERYDEPLIDHRWKIYYDRSSDKSQAYIPDTFTVVYPLQIGGQTVYDESGFPTGLSVVINIRYDRVVSLWGLSSQNYDASDYAALTDEQAILSIAERGGIYSYHPLSAQTTKEIALGTPLQGLVRFYLPAGDKKESAEVYIPSFIFPVTDAPTSEYYYPENVVVPLASDIVDELSGDGPVRIQQ